MGPRISRSNPFMESHRRTMDIMYGTDTSGDYWRNPWRNSWRDPYYPGYGRTQKRRSVDPKKMFKQGVENTFNSYDLDGNSYISQQEYVYKYLSAKERQYGRIINKSDPEYAKLVREATNMFQAISQDGTTITKERMAQYMKFLDSADGSADGRLNPKSFNKYIEAMKRFGARTVLTGGMTIGQILDLQRVDVDF